MTTYAIYTTGRAGSNWLCEMLRSTRRLGNPGEWFNPRVMPEYKADLGLEPTVDSMKYWIALQAKHATEGVMGVKCGWAVAAEVFDVIQPKAAIFLTRSDLLGQAISLFRAMQTGDWGSGLNLTCEIDVGEILAYVANLRRVEKRFLAWFEKTGQIPYHCTYEQLFQKPESIVRTIASLVNVVLPYNLELKSTMRIQRDEWTIQARNEVKKFFDDCDAYRQLTDR